MHVLIRQHSAKKQSCAQPYRQGPFNAKVDLRLPGKKEEWAFEHRDASGSQPPPASTASSSQGRALPRNSTEIPGGVTLSVTQPWNTPAQHKGEPGAFIFCPHEAAWHGKPHTCLLVRPGAVLSKTAGGAPEIHPSLCPWAGHDLPLQAGEGSRDRGTLSPSLGNLEGMEVIQPVKNIQTSRAEAGSPVLQRPRGPPVKTQGKLPGELPRGQPH